MASDGRVVLKTVEQALYHAIVGQKRQPLISEVIRKYHDALDGDEKNASLLTLADAFFNAGQYVRAGKIYAKLDNRQGALICVDLLITNKEHSGAGVVYQELNMDIKAAAEYEKDEKTLANAVSIYLVLRNWASAAAVYLKMKDYIKAGSAFENAGMLEDAAQAFEKGRRFVAAARVYGQLGRKDDTLRVLLNGNMESRLSAAGIIYDAGEKERAAGIYEEIWKAGPTRIIGLNLMPDQETDARIASTASERAIGIYTELGMTDKATVIRRIIDAGIEAEWREGGKDYG